MELNYKQKLIEIAITHGLGEKAITQISALTNEQCKQAIEQTQEALTSARLEGLELELYPDAEFN